MVTDDIKKLIESYRGWDPDEVDRYPMAASGVISDLLEKLEAEYQRAETLEANRGEFRNAWNGYGFEIIRLEAERDDLRAAVQPVLDAWNIPGVRPDYHEAAKFHLRESWSSLWRAVRDLSRAIDTKEK